MYNRDIVAEKVHQTSQRIKKPITYYTPDYLQACVAHLESKAVRDDKGRFKEIKEPLLPDEAAFIRNERLLCALDYDHWSSNYHYIRDSNTQEMVLFQRNFAQQAKNLIYCEMQAAEAPIMTQSLKARQVGDSTDSTSRGLHRGLFIPNTSGVLASSDEDKTWKLSEMMQRSLRMQPWWLIPDDLRMYVSGEVFLEAPARNMTIGIQHGRQTSGISRGDTINYYHLSEIPDFTDPESLIDASLMKAMHPTKLTFGVEESTANGRNDYWHNKWKNNNRRYAAGTGLVRPVFIPWFVARDIYPTVGWLRKVRIPTLWAPPPHIITHAEKAREWVLANDYLWRVLGLDWHLPLEQQWFYHVEYEEAKEKGEAALAKFYSEMPANDLEAFQSKLGGVFSIELLQQYQDRAKSPLAIYAIQGEGVPSPLWAEEHDIDHSKQVQQVRYWCNSTEKLHTYTLTPVRTISPEGLDRLVVWELPQPGSEYAVGLDGAEGKGLDRTTLPVVKKGTPLSSAELVAELATDKVGTLEIWQVWLALLRFYSVPYQGEMQWALATPEINRGGDAAMMELRKHDYPNIYIRTKPDSRLKLLSPKLGWETTPRTRDQLVQWILLIIKGLWAQVNSPWLVDELRDFVVKELQSKIRLEAGVGSHDDRIFAFIITMVCLHGIDVYQSSTPHWKRLVSDAMEMISFPRSRGLFLPTIDPEDKDYFTASSEVTYAETETEEEY